MRSLLLTGGAENPFLALPSKFTINLYIFSGHKKHCFTWQQTLVASVSQYSLSLSQATPELL
jgi:hypothetical protein